MTLVSLNRSQALLGGGARAEYAVLLVQLGGRRYGLPLAAVERVLPMASVLALPDASQGLLGMLNLHGEVVPVIDPRRHLGLGSPRISPDHRLVLLGGGSCRFLVWVDAVEEVVSEAASALTVVPTGPSNPLAPRVLRLGDEMVPVLAPSALEPRSGPGR
jgi:chemotaxis signal transduction protein